MGAFNILSTTTPTGGNQFRIIFDGHADSDTYIANSTIADRIDVVNNAVNTLAFTQTALALFGSVNLQMTSGKIISSTGNDLILDATDAGSIITALKSISIGTGLLPPDGVLRLEDGARINWRPTSGGSHGIEFETDVFRVLISNIVQLTFTATTLDITGANIVNAGALNTKSIPAGSSALMDLGTGQTVTSSKNFTGGTTTVGNFICNDTTPAFVVGSIPKDVIDGEAVNLTAIQSISGQKTFANFHCTDSAPDFLPNSIDGGDLVLNSVGLTEFVHTTGGRLITYTAGTAPAYLNIGSTDDVLTVVSGLPAWVAPSGGGDNLGLQDVKQTTAHNQTEIGHNFYMSNSKQGDLDEDDLAPNFVTAPQEEIYYLPFYVGASYNIERAGIDVGTVNANDWSIAIYDSHADINYPLSRITDSENQFLTGTGIQDIFFDEDISAGLYWVAIWFDNGSVSTIRAWRSQNALAVGYVPQNGTTGEMFPVQGWIEESVTSPALPTTPDNDMLVNYSPAIPAVFIKLRLQ
jgi:hypothetical protein